MAQSTTFLNIICEAESSIFHSELYSQPHFETVDPSSSFDIQRFPLTVR